MPNNWCKHVAAVAYLLIARTGPDPSYPFFLRQLNIASVRDRALKRKRDQANTPNNQICVIIDDEEEDGTRDRPICV